MYQFRKKSPSKVAAQSDRKPLEEQFSFGKVSSPPQSISQSSKEAKSGGAVASSAGSSDSEKPSSQTSQPVVKRLKYEMCKNWREKGTCKYGDKCLFAHGADELTKRSTANGPEPQKPVSKAEPEPKVEEQKPKESPKSSTEKISMTKVRP